MKFHRTTIPLLPHTDDEVQNAMMAAIIDLYRRSQAAEETGRLFIVMAPKPETLETELGLVRTNDTPTILALQTFYMGTVRELGNDEIMQLFRLT